MTVKERIAVAFLVWLGVYPSVLGMTYLLEWIGLGGLPLPVRLLITTAGTVPTIEFLVVPVVKRIVARAEERADLEGRLRED